MSDCFDDVEISKILLLESFSEDPIFLDEFKSALRAVLEDALSFEVLNKNRADWIEFVIDKFIERLQTWQNP